MPQFFFIDTCSSASVDHDGVGLAAIGGWPLDVQLARTCPQVAVGAHPCPMLSACASDCNMTNTSQPLHATLARQRFFAWIQWQRRILVRWEYHAHNFLGFVQLACLLNAALPRPAQVHNASRRRGGSLAARGTSAAGGDAGDRLCRRCFLSLHFLFKDLTQYQE
jgi:hypothetical protein